MNQSKEKCEMHNEVKSQGQLQNCRGMIIQYKGSIHIIYIYVSSL